MAIGDIVELIRPKPSLLLRESLRDSIVISRVRIRLFRHVRTSAPVSGLRSNVILFLRLRFPE